MGDNATIVGIVALSTAIFTGLGIILRHIRHSECMRGLCEIDTRSPNRDSIAPPPTPQIHHHNRKRKYAESENDEKETTNDENKSEFKLDIIEVDV